MRQELEKLSYRDKLPRDKLESPDSSSDSSESLQSMDVTPTTNKRHDKKYDNND